MNSRRLQYEHWVPGPPVRIHAHVRPPMMHDEHAPLPDQLGSTRSSLRKRSDDIITMSPYHSTTFVDDVQVLPEPEIVDCAVAAASFPVHNMNPSPPRRTSSWRRKVSSSVISQRSQTSVGILEYYLEDTTPPQTPKMTVPSPANTNPPVKHFDFGFPGTKSTLPDPIPLKDSSDALPVHKPEEEEDVEAGAADNSDDSDDTVDALSSSPAISKQRDTYSLFPPKSSTREIIRSSPEHPGPCTTVAGPSLPLSAYRGSHENQFSPQLPRYGRPVFLQDWSVPTNSNLIQPLEYEKSARHALRDSLLSSARNRKDSVASCEGSAGVPLRILSYNSNVTANSRSSASNSTVTASPLHRSRWSNDTITSPTAASFHGGRTSSALMSGRQSSQYPASFFEDDDDEEAPLRSHFIGGPLSWINKRQTVRSSPTGQLWGAVRQTGSEKQSWATKARSYLLCSGCLTRKENA